MPLKVIKERISSFYKLGLDGPEDEINQYYWLLSNYCNTNLCLEKITDYFYTFIISEKQFLRTRAAQILNTVKNKNQWSYKAALELARQEFANIPIEKINNVSSGVNHIYDVHPKGRIALEEGANWG